MIRFIARYVAIFRLLWITKSIRGDFRILAVKQVGNETLLLLPHNQDTQVQGIQSLFWASRRGHAVVEPGLIDTDGRWFKLLANYGEEPETTNGAWLSGWLGERLEHFGDLKYQSVRMPNGTLAIQAMNSQANWVIHVHGRKALVGETLRNFKLFDELGFSQLSISHETDPKPLGLGSHRSTLGFLEWKQLDSAVSYAISQGAKRVVLFGWSLGGMMVGQFLRESTYASSVVAAIYDSPMFDVRNTLRFQAESSGYDFKFSDEVCDLINSSKLLGIFGYPRMNLDELSLAQHKIQLALPMLVMYSKNDGYIAYGDSEIFAQINSSVRLIEFQGARHCRLMNSDPSKYAQAITTFISGLDI